MEQSLFIWEQRLGDDHPDVATSLNNLAELYRVQERYGEAEALYGRSLEIREQQLGVNHLDVAHSLNNLAALYFTQGRYSEAEPLYGRSLEIRIQKLGQEHLNTQNTLNNFITCLQAAIAANQIERLSNHPFTQAILAQLRES